MQAGHAAGMSHTVSWRPAAGAAAGVGRMCGGSSGWRVQRLAWTWVATRAAAAWVVARVSAKACPCSRQGLGVLATAVAVLNEEPVPRTLGLCLVQYMTYVDGMQFLGLLKKLDLERNNHSGFLIQRTVESTNLHLSCRLQTAMQMQD